MPIENVTMALLLLSAWKGDIPSTHRGIAKRIVEIRGKNMDIGYLYIKRDAFGYYCDSLYGFLYIFELMGDLESKEPDDPIILNWAGVDSCKDIIRSGFRQDYNGVATVAKELNFDPSEFVSWSQYHEVSQ